MAKNLRLLREPLVYIGCRSCRIKSGTQVPGLLAEKQKGHNSCLQTYLKQVLKTEVMAPFF